MKKVNVNDLVVLNKTPDAVIWRVMKLDGPFNVGITEAFSNKAYPTRLQWIDISLMHKPTKTQLSSAGL